MRSYSLQTPAHLESLVSNPNLSKLRVAGIRDDIVKVLVQRIDANLARLDLLVRREKQERTQG
eukprot:m.147831 g.147831  ORF g.147831 m.147831 type:complete len:63 (+) comp52736_c0_seq6:1515-1703(+)